MSFEIKREPIPTTGPAAKGKWLAVLEAAREAATQGECVVITADQKTYASATASLYGHRKLRPEEKIHCQFDSAAGVLRVWITQRSAA